MIRFGTGSALALIFFAMTAGAATAQAAYQPPRTPEGKPDLQGVWTNSTLTPMERPVQYGQRRDMTEEEARKIEGVNEALMAERAAPTAQDAKVEEAGHCDPSNCGYNQFWVDPGNTVVRVGGVPRTSMITFPANGRTPALTPAAQAQAEERYKAGGGFRGETFAERSAGYPGQNDNPETRSAGERCLIFAGPVMLPSLYNNNYQFVQTKDHLAIVVEQIHDTRIIRIGGKPRTDGIIQYMGDSIGWWEGDTLVAETTGFHPIQTFRGGSSNMKVTEKFTRVAEDRVLYQFKVEDPSAWAEPWGGEYEFGRTKGELYEYACHEGNYGLWNILSGARKEDRDNAAKAAKPARASKSP